VWIDAAAAAEYTTAGPLPLRVALDRAAAEHYGAVPDDLRAILADLAGAERSFLRLAGVVAQLLEGDGVPGIGRVEGCAWGMTVAR